MVLHTFRYERFLPRQVVYLSVNHPGIEPSRKHEHMIVTLEPCFHHSREIAALPTGLVDAYANRAQTGQEE